MTSELQEIGLLQACNIAVLACVTFIDKVVHCDLYRYGLQFSREWADPYWAALYWLAFAISAYAMAAYWFHREETLRNVATALLIGVSNILVFVNLDLLWFVFAGGLPPLDAPWWWMPLPNWTTAHQIIYTAFADESLILLWTLHVLSMKFAEEKT